MNDNDIKKFIYNELSNFNFKRETKGFKYLCDAIFICIKDENALDNLSKNVFPQIAEKYNEKSFFKVKWCIEQILKTNLELKLTFEKLIRTMKEPVEWNGTFVVVGDYLILQGRVRSLFFNFENRKVLTNIIDIPVKEEDVIELDNHTKVQK